jgi:hypothetical protein
MPQAQALANHVLSDVMTTLKQYWGKIKARCFLVLHLPYSNFVKYYWL